MEYPSITMGEATDSRTSQVFQNTHVASSENLPEEAVSMDYASVTMGEATVSSTSQVFQNTHVASSENLPEEAVSKLKQEIEKLNRDGDGYFVQGKNTAQSKLINQAIQCYKLALAAIYKSNLSVKFGDNFINGICIKLGDACLLIKNYRGAKIMYTAVLSKDPRNHYVQRRLMETQDKSV